MAIVIGHIGSDGGYTVIGSDGSVHRVPGWAEQQLADFVAATQVLGAATQIRAPGVAAEMARAARGFIERQVETHIKGEAGDRTIIIIGG